MIKVINIIIKIIYLLTIGFIAKEDIKNKKINKRIILYSSLFSMIYMLGQTILDISYIHVNMIYLIIFIVLFILDIYILKKLAKESYLLSILTLLTLVSVFTGVDTFIKTILVTVLAIIFQVIINKTTKKKNIQTAKNTSLPLAFFIGVSNISAVLLDLII